MESAQQEPASVICLFSDGKCYWCSGNFCPKKKLYPPKLAGVIIMFMGLILLAWDNFP
jgi:hypothetical protein